MFCLLHAIFRNGVSALLLFLCALPAWASTVSGMGQASAATSHPFPTGESTLVHARPAVSSSATLSATPSVAASKKVEQKACAQTILVQQTVSTPSSTLRPMDGAAMYRVGQEKNLCALTFDDGPGPHTARLLDILAERGIRATFFVLGDRAARNSALIRRMVDEGHEVANHTYSHKSLRQLSEQVQAAEIGQVQDTLLALGVHSRYLRPPFGRYDAVTLRIAAEMGLQVVLWSVDSNDWQRRVSVDALQSVYGRPARNGIMLFHDTHQPTVDAMDVILGGLIVGQCRFVTVSEFMDEACTNALPDTLVVPEHPEIPVNPELPETPVRYVQGADPATTNATAASKSAHPANQGNRSNPADAPSEPIATDAAQSANPADTNRPEWLPSVIGTFRSWARGVLSDSSAHNTP